MKYIAAFYNIPTNTPLCYLINEYTVTSDFKKATEFVHETTLAHQMSYTVLAKVLNGIYNGKDSGSMLEHEYFHIREDYFGGVQKKDVMYIIRTKNAELILLRKKKILKIYEKL